MEPADTPTIDAWVDSLFDRHLRELTFPELRRSAQALSAAYVERRKLHEPPRALDGKGKRAAFACYFAPLHFLVVREIVVALAASEPVNEILDLGCGSLSAGLAWGTTLPQAPRVDGVDTSSWAIAEGRQNLAFFGLNGRPRAGDLLACALPSGRSGIVAAYAVNELPTEGRARLLARVLAAHRQGATVLVVEPIARLLTAAWWPTWEAAFVEAGGRSDTWRFSVALPKRLKELDRAAGLNHQELTARSLYVAAAAVDPRSPSTPLV